MKIVIQGEVHSSKNSRRIMRNRKTGAPFVAKSKSSKADELLFALQLAEQAGTWARMTAAMPFPLLVIFRFRRKTRGAFDYVNLAQGILDAMVKAEYIPDDDANHVVPFFAPYIVTKDAGCDLYIGKQVILDQVEKELL